MRHTHTHTEGERERERQRHRQREKQAPPREPDVGREPGSPGSYPGLKVALNRWATRVAPLHGFNPQGSTCFLRRAGQ